jgi:hypothetical protein
MAQAKQASKRKRRKTALPLIGAAGASLAVTGGASAAAPAANEPHHDAGPQFILAEEEIADVSLATFYVFDKENGSQLDQGLLTPAAVVVHGRGCRGCRGCRACGRACRGCARACGAGCRGVVIGACAGCGGGCGTCRRWSPRLGRWVFVC